MNRTPAYCLVLSLSLGCSLLSAQEAGNLEIRQQGGVTIKTKTRTLDGKPVELNGADPPVQIIQIPGTPGEPNRVEFRFDAITGEGDKPSEKGTKRQRGNEPTTMRQVRIGDYKTDGVLMMGDMWQTMASQLLSRFLGPVELKTLRKDQSLADFAEQHGTTENEIKILHPLMEFDSRDADLPVCVNLMHRVLPGETLEFLADLYQTDETTLRKINDIKPNEEITWRRLRMPVVMEMGRFGLSCYVVMYAPKDRKPAFNLNEYKVKIHRVSSSEDLPSIAELYRQTIDNLVIMNGLTAEQDLVEGQMLVVQSELRLADNVEPEWLVHAIDSELDVDLGQLLKLNQLKSPEELRGRTVIALPKKTDSPDGSES